MSFSVSRLAGAALLAVATQSVGCGERRLGPATSEAAAAIALAPRERHLVLTAPPQTQPLSLVLATTEGQSILEHAQVGVSANPGMFSNIGSGAVTLAPHAAGGTLVATGAVVLQQHAKILGNLTAASLDLQSQATVVGTKVVPASLQGSETLVLSVSFPAANADAVVVASHQERVLAPGRYATLSVQPHGKLVLAGGTYYFESWETAANSNVSVQPSGGSTTIVVDGAASLTGTWSHPGGYRGVAFVGSGGAPFQLRDSFRGTVVAPSSSVSLMEHSVVRGAVFARQVTIRPHAAITFEAANFLAPLVHPPQTNVAECANAIAPRADLQGLEKERAFQQDIARYCSMGGGAPVSECTINLVAKANVDYFIAGAGVVGNTLSPAAYLAIVRDRTRKRYAADDDPARANALCLGQDDDDDWIPNDVDACPNTPPQTPTTDAGCPETTLPQAPSAEQVQAELARRGMMFKPECANAVLPAKLPAGGFYRPASPQEGTYIFAARAALGGEGCPLWYFFDVQELDGNRDVIERYSVAFQDKEQHTSFLGQPKAVPDGFMQFRVLPTEAGTRGHLGSYPTRISTTPSTIRYRVRILSGGGRASGWSEWKITTLADCVALGLNCGQ